MGLGLMTRITQKKPKPYFYCGPSRNGGGVITYHMAWQRPSFNIDA